MLAVLILLLACACAASGSSRLSRFAADVGIAEVIVRGDRFRHRIFANRLAAAADADLLFVFIEGDGRPWTNGGRTPARDPTARRPLGFQLFLATAQPALYVTRPCYEGLRDPGCTVELWTSARYSTAVVDSLAAALRAGPQPAADRELVLVGYSGGGVLAALLATRLPRVAGVISVAANLDVAAWTARHDYLPLVDSLDPAREPAMAGFAHVALTGGKDDKVPPATIAEYLETHPGTVVLEYPVFDHVCCWQRDWADILPRALQRLQVTGGRTNDAD